MKPLKRTIKGHRPRFNEDLEIDRLQGMVMAMATEMAALYARIDTLERVAADKGVVLQEELENFSPDETTEAQREAWRQQFLGRLFYLHREELDDRLQGDDDTQYQAFLNEIAR